MNTNHTYGQNLKKKSPLKKTFLDIQNWVKIIQTAGYNGARTVPKWPQSSQSKTFFNSRYSGVVDTLTNYGNCPTYSVGCYFLVIHRETGVGSLIHALKKQKSDQNSQKVAKMAKNLQKYQILSKNGKI